MVKQNDGDTGEFNNFGAYAIVLPKQIGKKSYEALLKRLEAQSKHIKIIKLQNDEVNAGCEKISPDCLNLIIGIFLNSEFRYTFQHISTNIGKLNVSIAPTLVEKLELVPNDVIILAYGSRINVVCALILFELN